MSLNVAQMNCAICNDQDNSLFICILCKTKVHKECYGSELLSFAEGTPWICQRCNECISKIIAPSKLMLRFVFNRIGVSIAIMSLEL